MKPLFVALVLPLVFLACVSEDLVTIEGTVRHTRVYPEGPHYPVIVASNGKVYTILPPEEAERILDTSGLTQPLIRFKVRLLKETQRYKMGENIEGTVTPVSWEILDPLTGEVIKNHPLRRSRWSR
jgi:hypothetical protein